MLRREFNALSANVMLWLELEGYGNVPTVMLVPARLIIKHSRLFPIIWPIHD